MGLFPFLFKKFLPGQVSEAEIPEMRFWVRFVPYSGKEESSEVLS